VQRLRRPGEYERLQTLHDDDRNVSDKALQAAEAIWRADDAGTQAAREALAAVERNARQQWGDPLALAVTVGSPLFERLAARREILLQVSLPAGVAIGKPPQTARVQDANNSLRSAALVSPAQRTDARLQGASFFYVAEAEGLMPGMTVIVLLPVEAQAAQAQGVVVPASAVVWWQGKAWVYVAQQKDHFVRREIATDHPLEDGWFAAQGFAASEAVVIKGAQLLLSDEFRAQIQVGEEGEKKCRQPPDVSPLSSASLCIIAVWSSHSPACWWVTDSIPPPAPNMMSFPNLLRPRQRSRLRLRVSHQSRWKCWSLSQ